MLSPRVSGAVGSLFVASLMHSAVCVCIVSTSHFYEVWYFQHILHFTRFADLKSGLLVTKVMGWGQWQRFIIGRGEVGRWGDGRQCEWSGMEEGWREECGGGQREQGKASWDVGRRGSRTCVMGRR